MTEPVQCPLCDWQLTGTTMEKLHGFRAHKKLDHGLPLLEWESIPGEEGWRARRWSR